MQGDVERGLRVDGDQGVIADEVDGREIRKHAPAQPSPMPTDRSGLGGDRGHDPAPAKQLRRALLVGGVQLDLARKAQDDLPRGRDGHRPGAWRVLDVIIVAVRVTLAISLVVPVRRGT